MIEQFLNDAAAVQRMRASPVGSQLDSFVGQLTELGYARASIRDRLWTLSVLGRWLQRRHFRIGDLRNDVTTAFLKRHSPARRVRRSDKATLRLFRTHLEATGIIPAPPSPALSPTLQLKAQYEAYLRHDRGLSPVTGPRHWFILRRFGRGRFGEGPIDLRGVTADDVTRHVLAQIPSRSPASAQLYASTLRSFFRFLWQTGVTTADLTAAIPPVRRWRLVDVPKYLAPDEVTRVLKACDRSSPVGRRDYAILLLLARLGLRGGEVVRLELDDLDWHTGALAVRGKGSVCSQLPLPSDVGEALVTDLRHDRPCCDTRRVFVRARAPHRGLGHPSTEHARLHGADESGGERADEGRARLASFTGDRPAATWGLARGHRRRAASSATEHD
jgi:integrase/recombinase XerD